jgi:hypothetical protein
MHALTLENDGALLVPTTRVRVKHLLTAGHVCLCALLRVLALFIDCWGSLFFVFFACTVNSLLSGFKHTRARMSAHAHTSHTRAHTHARAHTHTRARACAVK